MQKPNYIDDRMLNLLDLLKDYNIIRFDREFCEAVGLLPQNLINIRKGKNHFTPEHIHRAVRHFKLNANWIFGTETELFGSKLQSKLLTSIK